MKRQFQFRNKITNVKGQMPRELYKRKKKMIKKEILMILIVTAMKAKYFKIKENFNLLEIY